MKWKIIPEIRLPQLPIGRESLAIIIYQESEEVDERDTLRTWGTLLPSSRFQYRRVATFVLNLIKKAVKEDRTRARKRKK